MDCIQKEFLKLGEKMRKSKKIVGFTMIELMIVISVISILVLVLIPRISGLRNDVRMSNVEANLYAVSAVCARLIDDYDEPEALGKAILKEVDGRVKNPFSDSKNVLFAYTVTGATVAAEGSHGEFHGWKTGKTDTTTWNYSDDGKPSAVLLWIQKKIYDGYQGAHYYFASDGNTLNSQENIFPNFSNEISASKGAVVIAITKREGGSTLWGRNLQINLYAFDEDSDSITSSSESPTFFQTR